MNYEKELKKLKKEMIKLREAIETDRRELLLDLESHYNQLEDDAIDKIIDHERCK